MDNKKLLDETGRWLRVGALTASTFGPIVGTLLERLRQRQELEHTTLSAEPPAVSAADEKLSLADSLALLKERAYNQELVHRAEELTEELRMRGTRLSQLLAERSSDLTHEFGKQSELVGKKLSKQTREVSRNIAEQDSAFWIVSGFSVGVLIAGITAFILIRKRLQKRVELELEEDEHILLSPNGHVAVWNGTASSKASVAIPADAAFMGIASTKRYYSIQTPLDQLVSKHDLPLDVIYFVSEEDAKAQGFMAAEKL
ncbi:MAG TPA: hypothetical protein VL485_07240 [Ktedonobacteraceae bacterium]|jgi:hypothetical protein|nr:hypothetical protein [Ktedonobacteraceae bacterium]